MNVEESKPQAFGPHWSYQVWLLMVNPLNAISLIGLFVTFRLPYKYANYVVIACSVILCSGVLYSYLRWYTTEYILDIDRNLLILNSGIAFKMSDSVMLTLIYDCDTRESPFQQMFHVGTLVVRIVRNNKQVSAVSLPFVKNVDDIRTILLSQSGVARSRFLTTL